MAKYWTSHPTLASNNSKHVSLCTLLVPYTGQAILKRLVNKYKQHTGEISYSLQLVIHLTVRGTASFLFRQKQLFMTTHTAAGNRKPRKGLGPQRRGDAAYWGRQTLVEGGNSGKQRWASLLTSWLT